MPNFNQTTPPLSIMSDYTKKARMELALADWNQQEYPNVLQTSKNYDPVESTLRRRWKGQILSHEEISSEYKQRLSTAQEEVLIQRINQLANRGIPTTSRIVHNLAEEMVQGPVDSMVINSIQFRVRNELN